MICLRIYTKEVERVLDGYLTGDMIFKGFLMANTIISACCIQQLYLMGT